MERAARLADLPDPVVVTLMTEDWPPDHDGWRVMLLMNQRVMSVLLPPGELSVDRLALTLRLMAAGDAVP